MRQLQTCPPRIRGSLRERTGPLDPLANQDVLVLADQQNLDEGARDLGRKLVWGELARILQRACRSLSRHVFFAEPPGDHSQTAYFTARGWRPSPKQVRQVRTWRGTEREANIDLILTFFAGLLVRQWPATRLLICSGDGQLVENLVEGLDLAAAMGQIARPLPVITLSVPGSTASRLRAGSKSHIVANLMLGADCLRERP